MEKKHNKFILAHFNPKELNLLDDMQGGRSEVDGSDLRHFGPLEEMLRHPHIEKMVVKEYEHHAKGGRIGDILREADQMRHKGRHGDSEAALIGPHTHRIFNHLMHGGSVNPMTGHPEFFNLGGFLGGIGKSLMGAVPGAITGFMRGGPMGALAGGGASLLSNVLGGGGGGEQPAQQAMRAGTSMGQKAPNSLPQLGQQFMNSPMGQNMMNSRMGQMAQNAYHRGSEMMNSPMGQMAQDAYHHGSQFMNSPMGQQMMNSPMGQQVANSRYGRQARNMYNQGQNFYNQGRNMYNQANQGYQNMMDQGNEYNNQD